MWYRKLLEVQKSGDLQLVGLIQEQHPERCRLFMAWKQMRFPILVDALNRASVHAIPMMWALDEKGVVVRTRPSMDWLREEFLPRKSVAKNGAKNAASQPALPRMEEGAGVRAYLAGRWTEAVKAFARDCAARPSDGVPFFRLGCAYRARFDSAEREEADFQNAIDAWTQAVALSPANYIFRRRLQQYGPRLSKPYPFYSWVAQARREMKARGETPPPLRVEPKGSELAAPLRGDLPAASAPEKEPDPKAGVPSDDKDSVAFEAVLAPRPARLGANLAVHLIFRPSLARGTTWDNSAGPLQVWLAPHKGLRVAHRLWTHPLPKQASTAEERSIDFELALPKESAAPLFLRGYALYFVCEKKSGLCTFLRRDFKIEIPLQKPKGKKGSGG